MIKKNDLRVGNKLLYYIGEEGCEWDETTVDWQDIRWCEANPINFNVAHKPIPLTEEWLLKMGFEKDNDGYVIFKNSFQISFNDDDLGDCFLGYKKLTINDRGFINIKCEYVHQLMNLYHALTGEELEVK